MMINPRSEIQRKDEYKTTLVKRGASIGANATIVCGVTIGEYALVGAGSVVTRDVPAYTLVYGNPARIMGGVCRCGVKLSFMEDGMQKNAECQQCGCRYKKIDNIVTPVDQ